MEEGKIPVIKDGEFTSIWELEKQYDNKYNKKSAWKAGIFNFIFIGLSIIFGGYIVLIAASDLTIMNSYLFGFCIGMLSMWLGIVFISKIIKIKIESKEEKSHETSSL